MIETIRQGLQEDGLFRLDQQAVSMAVHGQHPYRQERCARPSRVENFRAADKWTRVREVELEDPTALIRPKHGRPSLASLIRWYIDEFKSVANWGVPNNRTWHFSSTTRLARATLSH